MSVQPPVKAIPSQRLTVWPCASFSTNVSSRDLLYPVRDFIQGVVPGNVLPVGGSGAAHLRFQEAPFVEDVLFERSAFRAESPAIDGMVRIAFNVDYLGSDILGLVAQRVDDHAATYRAIRARRARFRRPGDLQFAKFRVGGPQIKSENGGCRATKGCYLEE